MWYLILNMLTFQGQEVVPVPFAFDTKAACEKAGEDWKKSAQLHPDIRISFVCLTNRG